jgi:hypothetical protein
LGDGVFEGDVYLLTIIVITTIMGTV